MTGWDPLEAELADVELRVHCSSPESNADYLSLLGSESATADAAYLAARRRGSQGDADALAAADEQYRVRRKIGVAKDGIQGQRRTIAVADCPPMTVLTLGDWP